MQKIGPMFLDLVRFGLEVRFMSRVHFQERAKILAEKFGWDQQVRWKLVPDQLYTGRTLLTRYSSQVVWCVFFGTISKQFDEHVGV